MAFKPLLQEIECYIEEGVECLSRKDDDWKPRRNCLDRLHDVFNANKFGQKEAKEIVALLENMTSGLQLQLSDARSIVAKTTCKTIGAMAQSTGKHFSHIASELMPSLLSMTYVTVAVISDSGNECIRALLQEAQVDISSILDACLNAKNEPLRIRASEYINLILEKYPKEELDPSFNEITEAVQASLHNANSKVRIQGREALLKMSYIWTEHVEMLIQLPEGNIRNALRKYCESSHGDADFTKLFLEKYQAKSTSPFASLRRARPALKEVDTSNLLEDQANVIDEAEKANNLEIVASSRLVTSLRHDNNALLPGSNVSDNGLSSSSTSPAASKIPAFGGSTTSSNVKDTSDFVTKIPSYKPTESNNQEIAEEYLEKELLAHEADLTLNQANELNTKDQKAEVPGLSTISPEDDGEECSPVLPVTSLNESLPILKTPVTIDLPVDVSASENQETTHTPPPVVRVEKSHSNTLLVLLVSFIILGGMASVLVEPIQYNFGLLDTEREAILAQTEKTIETHRFFQQMYRKAKLQQSYRHQKEAQERVDALEQKKEAELRELRNELEDSMKHDINAFKTSLTEKSNERVHEFQSELLEKVAETVKETQAVVEEVAQSQQAISKKRAGGSKKKRRGGGFENNPLLIVSIVAGIAAIAYKIVPSEIQEPRDTKKTTSTSSSVTASPLQKKVNSIKATSSPGKATPTKSPRRKSGRKSRTTASVH